MCQLRRRAGGGGREGERDGEREGGKQDTAEMNTELCVTGAKTVLSVSDVAHFEVIAVTFCVSELSCNPRHYFTDTRDAPLNEFLFPRRPRIDQAGDAPHQPSTPRYANPAMMARHEATAGR